MSTHDKTFPKDDLPVTDAETLKDTKVIVSPVVPMEEGVIHQAVRHTGGAAVMRNGGFDP